MTHMPIHPEDKEPLTPNHFLLGGVNSSQVPTEISEKRMRSINYKTMGNFATIEIIFLQEMG